MTSEPEPALTVTVGFTAYWALGTGACNITTSLLSVCLPRTHGLQLIAPSERKVERQKLNSEVSLICISYKLHAHALGLSRACTESETHMYMFTFGRVCG